MLASTVQFSSYRRETIPILVACRLHRRFDVGRPEEGSTDPSGPNSVPATTPEGLVA